VAKPRAEGVEGREKGEGGRDKKKKRKKKNKEKCCTLVDNDYCE